MRFSKPRFPIRALLVGLVVAVLAPLLTFVGMEFEKERRHAQTHAYGSATVAARGVATRLDTKLDETKAMLTALATKPWVQAVDPARCEPATFAILTLHPEFSALEIRDTGGRVVCAYSTRPGGGADERPFPWFKEELHRGAFAASNALQHPVTGHWVTVITYPIRDAQGNIAGLLVVTVELKALLRQVISPLPEGIRAGVIDREGKILLSSHQHEERVGKALPAAFLAKATAREGTFKDSDLDGTPRLFAYASVGNTGWHARAGLDERLVLRDFWELLTTDLVLGVPFLAVVLAATLWLASFFAVPISSLARAAARISGGDSSARADVSGPAEVREVATQFNRMLDTIQRHGAESAALSAHFNQLSKAARDIILLIDPEGHIVDANDAAIAAYGYGIEEIRSLGIRDLRSTEDATALQQQWDASRRPEGVLFEATHRRKDGSTFAVEVSARAIEIDGKPFRQSFVRDITARKEAEKARHDAEQQFRTAIEGAPDGIFIQAHKCFVYLNPAALRLFGATDSQELVGKPVVDHIHPEFRDRVRERIRRLNEDLMPVTAQEEAILRRDGSRQDVEVSAVPFDWKGEHGALVFIRDCSERKRSLGALRESERRFRNLVEEVPSIAVQGYDRERRVVFWNQASAALYGYSRDEAIGQRLEDLIIPADLRDSVVAAVTQWVDHGIAIPAGELTLRHKDGTSVSVYSAHAMLANLEGAQEMFCLDIDLAPLKRAQSEASDWRNRYEAAILASGQLLQEWTPATNDIRIIGDTERFLGFAAAELAGSLDGWRERLHPEDRTAYDREVARSVTDGKPFHLTYRIQRKDGNWISAQDDGYFVRDASGAISCMVCFISDITERAAAQQHIEAQLHELRRWHDAMLGREARVLELKREVNDLLAAAGLAARYGVTDLHAPEKSA